MPNGPVVSEGVPKTGSYPTAGTDALTSRVTGDAFDRYVLNADGSFESGNGTVAPVPAGFTGPTNTRYGLYALYSNTTGSYNTASGVNALYSPNGLAANGTTTGNRQTALGVETGQASATQRNDITTVGYRALADGDFATSLGSGTNAGATGAVAIGTDNAGTGATTVVANEIKLGTALHTLNVIGNAQLGGAGKTVGLYGVAPVVRAAAIAAPTAPGTTYSQADAQSAVTAINAIRAALQNIGITA